MTFNKRTSSCITEIYGETRRLGKRCENHGFFEFRDIVISYLPYSEVVSTAVMLAAAEVVQRPCIDVTQGDSGNYTCEVDGPQNTILGQTTHYVYVRGSLLSLLLVIVISA